MNEKSREMSAIGVALRHQIQILQDELSILRAYALNHQWCNCGIARYNHNRAVDDAAKVESSMVLPMAYTCMQQASVSSLVANQAGVRYAPGMLEDNLEVDLVICAPMANPHS